MHLIKRAKKFVFVFLEHGAESSVMIAPKMIGVFGGGYSYFAAKRFIENKNLLSLKLPPKYFSLKDNVRNNSIQDDGEPNSNQDNDDKLSEDGLEYKEDRAALYRSKPIKVKNPVNDFERIDKTQHRNALD